MWIEQVLESIHDHERTLILPNYPRGIPLYRPGSSLYLAWDGEVQFVVLVVSITPRLMVPDSRTTFRRQSIVYWTGGRWTDTFESIPIKHTRKGSWSYPTLTPTEAQIQVDRETLRAYWKGKGERC